MKNELVISKYLLIRLSLNNIYLNENRYTRQVVEIGQANYFTQSTEEQMFQIRATYTIGLIDAGCNQC